MPRLADEPLVARKGDAAAEVVAAPDHHDRSHRLGRTLVNNFYLVTKTLGMFDAGNVIAKPATSTFLATLHEMAACEGEATLRTSADCLFVNDTRLRIDFEGFVSFRFIVEIRQRPLARLRPRPRQGRVAHRHGRRHDVEGEAGLRPRARDCDAYLVEMGNGSTFRWKLPLILRGDVAWKSVGAVHEYTARVDGNGYDTGDAHPHVRRSRTPTSVDHEEAEVAARDAQRGVREGPREPAHRVLPRAVPARDGRLRRGSGVYLRRATMGGYDSEVYYANFQAATLIAEWPKNRLVELLKVWEYRPHRLEALAMICRDLNARDQHRTVWALTSARPTSMGVTDPADDRRGLRPLQLLGLEHPVRSGPSPRGTSASSPRAGACVSGCSRTRRYRRTCARRSGGSAGSASICPRGAGLGELAEALATRRWTARTSPAVVVDEAHVGRRREHAIDVGRAERERPHGAGLVARVEIAADHRQPIEAMPAVLPHLPLTNRSGHSAMRVAAWKFT